VLDGGSGWRQANREHGLHEAAERINRTVDAGADLGLLFPRNPKEAEQAPKVCRLPQRGARNVPQTRRTH
jgi:hypothetical protein